MRLYFEELGGRLREEPALNLDNLRGCGTLLIIVCHVIDPRADGIAPHPARIVGFQRFRNHLNILHPGIKPQVIIRLVEDDRHAIVDG